MTELHFLWDNTMNLYTNIQPIEYPSLVACIPQFAADVTRLKHDVARSEARLRALLDHIDES